jgi:hypothetical protein
MRPTGQSRHLGRPGLESRALSVQDRETFNSPLIVCRIAPVRRAPAQFAAYRPPNLAAWAKGKDVDPGNVVEAVRATDPKVGVA